MALNLEDKVPDQLAFAFQKDSEIRPLFMHHLDVLLERGVLAHSKQKWLARAERKIRNNKQVRLEREEREKEREKKEKREGERESERAGEKEK